MPIVSTSWGCLVAHYQQVKLVGDALSLRGIDHFIPKIESLSVVRGRHLRELRPLLGEYIPVSIYCGWRELLRLRGVHGILLNESGFPAQILHRELEWLRGQCDNGIYRRSIPTERGFQYGQKVTPADGPLANRVGHYERCNRRGEDIALFLLFGSEKKVTFKSGELLAV
jgi:transcription antitermination factor NusG